MTKHKRSILITYITLLAACFGLCVNQTTKSIQTNHLIIEKTFRQALDKDLLERLSTPEVNWQVMPIPIQIDTDLAKIKGVHFQSEEIDTVIPYTDDMTQEQIHLDNRIIHHSATRMIKPICPIHLNNLFAAILDTIGISAKTAVTYYDCIEKKHLYSNPDLQIYTYGIHTNIIHLGLEKEMEVQAFVHFTPHWIFQSHGKSVLFIILTFICLLATVFIHSYNFPLIKKIREYRKRMFCKHSFVKLKNGNYQLGKLVLDITNGLLINEQQEENISRRQEYILLLAFLKAPDRSLSKEDILKCLNKAVDSQNLINTIISRLRKLLQQDPQLSILYTNNDLYTLIALPSTQLISKKSKDSKHVK